MGAYQSESECGTAYCIAGWAEMDAIRQGDMLDDTDDCPQSARKHLGLTWEEAVELFVGPLAVMAEKPQVLLTLKHLLNTGKIDWEIKQPKHQAAVDKLLADALRAETKSQREDCFAMENRR